MKTNCLSDKALRAYWAFLHDQAQAMRIAGLVRQALIAEAELTPKPGLVDRRGAGAHIDLSLAIMRRSALAIEPYLCQMAFVSQTNPSSRYGNDLPLLDARRNAQCSSQRVSNSHKGAIWIKACRFPLLAMQDEPGLGIAATAR
jgi:triphosphoribosyl-dephospho-CoA synthase